MSTLLTLVYLADVILVLVQPGNPGDPGIPITEGIALLVSAAVGLGIRFFKKKKL